MIHLRTPSRLHFGLIDPAGITGRRFGGVGLMVQDPGTELTIEPADRWSVEGPLAARARKVMDRLLEAKALSTETPHRIHIHSAAPEHKGLGTGTQLSLAIARAMAEVCGWSATSAKLLGQLVGRGKRSAIGIHGFEHGGFLVEGGKTDSEISPLAAAKCFPDEWRVVLIIPTEREGLHDEKESEAFDDVKYPAELPGQLARHAQTMLAAVADKSFDEFAQALYQFNRLAGTPFARIQDGHYADAKIAGMVQWLRAQGVLGAGQSSWGPTVFAMAKDDHQVAWFAKNIQSHFSLAPAEIVITSADNRGARIRRD